MRGMCGHTFLQQTLLTISARSGCCESAAPPLLPGSGCVHALNIMLIKSLIASQACTYINKRDVYKRLTRMLLETLNI